MLEGDVKNLQSDNGLECSGDYAVIPDIANRIEHGFIPSDVPLPKHSSVERALRILNATHQAARNEARVLEA